MSTSRDAISGVSLVMIWRQFRIQDIFVLLSGYPLFVHSRIDTAVMDPVPACCELPAAELSTRGAETAALNVDAALTMTHDVPSAYTQLLALGMVMITCHCAGMCGPIMLSFRFGLHQQVERGQKTLALSQLAAYQSGRAVIYALFGAIAGGLAWLVAGSDFGESVGLSFATGTRGLVLVVAAAFLVAGIRRLRPPKAPQRKAPGPLARLGQRASKQLAERPIRGAALLGMVMAAVPCLIPAWTLGLAATTASPVHGALLMVMLVVMTTPALIPFALIPSCLPRAGRWGRQLQTAALLFSGVWLSIIGLAANGIIPHAATDFGPVTIHWW